MSGQGLQAILTGKKVQHSAMPVAYPSMVRSFQIFHLISLRLTRLWVLSLAVGLAIGLAGCSAVKLGYNNAPDLGYWWLDHYLDFNDTQSIQVRADLVTLQAWHRQREIPLLVGTLVTVQQLASGDVTPGQVCDRWAELKLRLRATLDQTEPAAVALATTLTAPQLDHLARQLDKRSAKWRAQWLDVTPSERAERRLKQLTERVEMFYGPLEETQLAVLRARVTASAFDASLNWRESQRRQKDIVQTLRQLQTGTPDQARIRAALQALLARSMNSPDAAYRSYVSKITRESCTLLAALHNSSTSAQRLKVIETLKDYETDARSLATVEP